MARKLIVVYIEHEHHTNIFNHIINTQSVEIVKKRALCGKVTLMCTDSHSFFLWHVKRLNSAFIIIVTPEFTTIVHIRDYKSGVQRI